MLSDRKHKGCTKRKPGPMRRLTQTVAQWRTTHAYLRSHPVLSFTVGFDRFFNLLDQPLRTAAPLSPYNIERTVRTPTGISVAVSGFSQGSFDRREGEHADDQGREVRQRERRREGRSALPRIAARAFERAFQLADFVQVKNASLENGLLHVDLVARFRSQEAAQHSDLVRAKAAAGGRRFVAA